MRSSKQLFLDYHRINLHVQSKKKKLSYDEMLKLIRFFPQILFTQIIWAMPYEKICAHYKDDIVADNGMQRTDILSQSRVELTKCFRLKNKGSMIFAILDSHFPLFLPPMMSVFELEAEKDNEGWLILKRVVI